MVNEREGIYTFLEVLCKNGAAEEAELSQLEIPQGSRNHISPDLITKGNICQVPSNVVSSSESFGELYP